MAADMKKLEVDNFSTGVTDLTYQESTIALPATSHANQLLHTVLATLIDHSAPASSASPIFLVPFPPPHPPLLL